MRDLESDDTEELRHLLAMIKCEIEDLSTQAAILASDMQRLAPRWRAILRAVGLHLNKRGRIKQGPETL